MPVARLAQELDPSRYTGRAAQQVEEFLHDYLASLLARASALAATAPAGEVRV